VVSDINKSNMKKENLLFILLASLLIIVFNLESIFVENLYQDDSSIYIEALNNSLVETQSRLNRSIIGPYVTYLFAELLVQSAYLARFILVLLSIFTSYLLFKFYIDNLELDFEVSVFASIIPFILPKQVLIPTFIMGSYLIWKIFFFLIVFLMLLKYLSHYDISKTSNKLRVCFITIGLFFSLQIFANPLIPIPFLFVLVYKYRRNIETQLIIATSILFIGFKLLKISKADSGVQEVTFFSLEEIIGRVQSSINYVNPITINHENQSTFFLVVFISLLLVSVISLIRNILVKKNIWQISNQHLGILFAIIWMACSLIPYLFSPYFASRYLFSFGFGYNLFIISILWLGFNRIEFLQNTQLKIITICALLLFSGINRNKEVDKFYKYRELLSQSLKSHLDSKYIPPNSQIVLLGKGEYINANGYWKWSSGYLKHLLNRPDITGLAGFKEKKFYDPIGINKRNYSHKMTGLELDKPLFVFYLNTDFVKDINYMLRYNYLNDKKDDEWVLYRIDEDNKTVTEFKKGYGKDELSKFINEKKIRDVDIFGY